MRHRTGPVGMRVVIGSHSTDVVHSFCIRSIWLEQGSVASEGCPSDVESQYCRSIEFGDGSQISQSSR